MFLFQTCVYRAQIWLNSFPVGKFQDAMCRNGRRLDNLRVRRGPFSSCEFARWRPRPISAVSFLAHELQKHIDGFVLAFKMMHLALPSPANPAPSPCQAGFTKQRAGDLHGVEAGHVFGWLGPFDIDVIRLRDHGDSVGKSGAGVQ